MQALRSSSTASSARSAGRTSASRFCPARSRALGLRVQAEISGTPTAPATPSKPLAPQPPITITDKALAHLQKLKQEHANSSALLLRVGVKNGGCSGMSYVMDFETQDKISGEDMVFEFDGGAIRVAMNPKSLLYLFGLRLDYSDALIGGGFQFHNPNATDSCGCGKSFGV